MLFSANCRPSIRDQPGEAGSPGRTTSRHPMGVERHVDAEQGDDQRPAGRFAPALFEQRQPAHRQDHRQRQFADHQRRAAGDDRRPGAFGPVDARSSAPAAAPPSFRGTGRSAAAACRRGRRRSGPWPPPAAGSGKQWPQPASTRQSSAPAHSSQMTTIIARSPNSGIDGRMGRQAEGEEGLQRIIALAQFLRRDLDNSRRPASTPAMMSR